MADNALLNPLQKITETEKLIYRLDKGDYPNWLDFQTGSPDFFFLNLSESQRQTFLTQLDNAFIEFFRNISSGDKSRKTRDDISKSIISIQINAWGISSSENVSLDEFRQLVNHILLKADDDQFLQTLPIPDVDQAYFKTLIEKSDAASLPDSGQIVSQDLNTVTKWRMGLIPYFREYLKGLPYKDEETKTDTQSTPAEEEKKQTENIVDLPTAGVAGVGFAANEAISATEGGPSLSESTTQPTPAITPDDIQFDTAQGHLFYLQEIQRESNIIEWQVINQFGLSELAVGLSPELEGLIEMAVASEIRTNLDKYLTNGRFTTQTRLKIIRAVLGRLHTNPYFHAYLDNYIDRLTGTLPEEIRAVKTEEIKTRKKSIKIQDLVDPLDDENFLESSKENLKKIAFKNQLQRSLYGTTYNPLYLDSLIKQNPNIVTLGELTPELFDHYFPENEFSLGVDQREELRKQLNTRIQTFQVADQQNNDYLFKAHDQDLELIDQTQLANLQHTLDSLSKDPHQVLKRLLGADVSKSLRLDLLDGFSMQSMSHTRILAHLKQNNLLPSKVLNDPRFTDIIISYIQTQKDRFASATNNQVILRDDAYFDTHPESVAEVGARFSKYIQRVESWGGADISHQKYSGDIVAHATYNANLLNVNWEELEKTEAGRIELRNRKLAYRLRMEVYLQELNDQQRAEYLARVHDQMAFQQQVEKYLSIQNEEDLENFLNNARFYQAQAPAFSDQFPAYFTNQQITQDQPLYDDRRSIRGRGMLFSPSPSRGFARLGPGAVIGGAVGGAAGTALTFQALGLLEAGRTIITSALIGGIQGAAAGAYFGSIIPVFGTAVGGFLGGLFGTGVGAGFGQLVIQASESGIPIISQIGDVTRFFIDLPSKGLELGAKAVNSLSSGATDAATQGKIITADTAKNLSSQATYYAKPIVSNAVTVSTGNIAVAKSIATTTTWAIAVPMTTTVVLTTLTMTTIFVAFLPDASVVPVSPSFTTDIVESRYISVRKTPDPTFSETPTNITYTVEIRKKVDTPEAQEAEIFITGIEDVLSINKKSGETVEPPALPQSALDQFTQYQGQPVDPNDPNSPVQGGYQLTTENPISFTFTVDSENEAYVDSLFKNDLKVKYTAEGVDEEANARAQTCFGDCPQAEIAACWPSNGKVTQKPYGRGSRSNPSFLKCLAREGSSAARTSSTHCGVYGITDAYDVGTIPPGQEGIVGIFAAGDGIVSQTSGIWEFGNYVYIDHGGFFSVYAHMASPSPLKVGDPVSGGDFIGYVGDTGNSFGAHLHYEIKGLSELILFDTLKGDYLDQTSIRCDQYYGKPQPSIP